MLRQSGRKSTEVTLSQIIDSRAFQGRNRTGRLQGRYCLLVVLSNSFKSLWTVKHRQTRSPCRQNLDVRSTESKLFPQSLCPLTYCRTGPTLPAKVKEHSLHLSTCSMLVRQKETKLLKIWLLLLKHCFMDCRFDFRHTNMHFFCPGNGMGAKQAPETEHSTCVLSKN